MEALNEVYFGNSLKNILLCVILLASGLLFKGFFARFLSWLTYKVFKRFSQEQFQKEFSNLVHKPFMHLVLLVIVYVAFHNIYFPDNWNFVPKSEFGIRWIILAVYKIVFIVVVTRIFLRSADFVEYVYHHLQEETVSKDLASFIKNLAKVLINVFAFFIILGEAFEVNITALVTSLGIGGLAIALAAQDTLANLIGSFIIYLDKPFQVGDLIEFSDIRGRVEKIGFRTTRIRTLDRALLLVPNKKIIDSNLINISMSEQRRVIFNLNLTYASNPEDIKQITAEISEAILSYKPMVADELTVKFAEFDSSFIKLLVIYFVNSNDFDVMIGIKEKINLRIMEIISNNGCQIAYPTQTVHLAK